MLEGLVQSYYNVFGGAAAGGQYPMYGGGSYTGTTAFLPYFQLGHGSSGAATYPHGQGGYSLQYPHLFQYSALNSTPFPHQYGGTMSLPPPTPAGVFLFLCHFFFTAFLPGYLVFLSTPQPPLFFFCISVSSIANSFGLGLYKTIGSVWISVKKKKEKKKNAGSLNCELMTVHAFR